MIARHDLVLGLTLCLSLTLSLLSHFSSSFTHSLDLCHFFSTSPPHFHLTLNLSTSFFVIYLLSFSIFCISITFILLVCFLPLCYSHPPSLSCMHSLFLNLSPFHNLLLYYLSLFSHTPSLSTPPCLSVLLLHVFIPLSQHHVCHGGKHRKQ